MIAGIYIYIIYICVWGSVFVCMYIRRYRINKRYNLLHRAPRVPAAAVDQPWWLELDVTVGKAWEKHHTSGICRNTYRDTAQEGSYEMTYSGEEFIRTSVRTSVCTELIFQSIRSVIVDVVCTRMHVGCNKFDYCTSPVIRYFIVYYYNMILYRIIMYDTFRRIITRAQKAEAEWWTIGKCPTLPPKKNIKDK